MQFPSQTLRWSSLIALFFLAGCRSPRVIRDAEYVDLLSATTQSLIRVDAIALAEAPVAAEFEGEHPVEQYVAYALAQNPRVQAARKRIEAFGNRVPQAASLEDPMLGVNGFPFFPYVMQTAGGRMTANVVAEQKLPWFRKLDTRAQAAEAETDMARAELAAAELEVIEQVKRAYYELYYLQKAIEITERSRKLLQDLAEIADIKYRTGDVSQQDVLRAQVEVSNLDGDLIRLRQQFLGGQARLAALLHISPETQLRAEQELLEEDIPRDLERLYQQAIASRPELHAQLAAIRRDRKNVDLARLQYYPDVTVGVLWGGMTMSGALAPTADGLSMVNIGAQVNVPLYRKRLDAGVREAEAQAVSSARQYDALKDRTQADVKDLYVQALSQRDLAALFRNDIIPKAQQTLEVSVEAYRVGKTDFLQLIDNWRELLRFQVVLHQLASQLRQTMSTLERVVGGTLPSATPDRQLPEDTTLPPVPPIDEPNARSPEPNPEP
jgi:outer membrane protein TolC